jgi:hypothetical protein
MMIINKEVLVDLKMTLKFKYTSILLVIKLVVQLLNTISQ